MPRVRRSRRLWPACLRSSAATDDQDTYVAAPSADNDANMAAVTSPDADVGDGPRTIQMSGGAPFGFRLSDDAEGRLIVSKVRLVYTALVHRALRHCRS